MENIKRAVPIERESIAPLFLPTFSFSDFYDIWSHESHEDMDRLAKRLLGTEEIEYIPSWAPEGLDPKQRAQFKRSQFYTLWFQYTHVFDLCRVIGARHLYDIGCQTVNQSFLLIDYTTMTYTGIQNSSFDLNDFQPNDIEEGYYHIINIKNPPEPLCNGRIRFIQGHYPNFSLEVPPNNIAIACNSLTMCATEESIEQTAAALSRDFERVLFNVNTYHPERVEIWKKQDWRGFSFFPIGPYGFVFGTKHPEDIDRMKELYPFDNGRFITGIGNMMPVGPSNIPQNPFERYVDWN